MPGLPQFKPLDIGTPKDEKKTELPDIETQVQGGTSVAESVSAGLALGKGLKEAELLRRGTKGSKPFTNAELARGYRRL